MKTNGVHGLNYHLFPGDLSNKLDKDIVANGLSRVVQGGNEIHVFVGAMPSEDDLYKITTVADLLDDTTGYGSSLAFSIGVDADDAIELNYTYDRTRKERVIKKWPVNAKSYTVKTDIPANSVLSWAAIKMEGVTPTGTEEQLLFTDAIGSWDDPETCILVDEVVVSGDDTIEFKDFTVSGRDVLVEDIVAGVTPPTITMDTTNNVAGSGSVKATITDLTDGSNVNIAVTDTANSTTHSYTAVLASGAIDSDISADFPNGLATGDVIKISVAGTTATMTVA